MNNFIDSIYASGSTNYEVAFKKAFQYMQESKAAGKTS